MTIIENPYISEKIDNPRRVIRRLKWRKLICGVYVIRQSKAPDELEILRSEFFMQKSLHDEDLPIVAFLAGYDEAVEYITELTQKSYEKYGFPYLNRYINEDTGSIT